MKDETVALKEWAKTNSKDILRQKPETKESGFCIVTGIHLAESCKLFCLEKSARELSGNLSGGLSGQGGKVEASTFDGRINPGWETRPVINLSQ